MTLATLVVRNTRRNLRRTILTVLTVALSTLIFAVLVAVPASMDRIVKGASARLRVLVNNRTGPSYGLPARYCDEILGEPGVQARFSFTRWLWPHPGPAHLIPTLPRNPV